MRALNARTDQFRFAFPNAMTDKTIDAKYNKYLSHKEYVINDIYEILQESLQEITIGSVSYDPIEQVTRELSGASRTVGHRHLDSEKNLITDKFLTLTFRYADGLINYMYLMEILLKKYSKLNTEKNIHDAQLFLYDNKGNRVFAWTFRQCHITNLEALSLAYNTGIRDFKTFTVNVYFNEFEVAIDLPEVSTSYETR